MNLKTKSRKKKKMKLNLIIGHRKKYPKHSSCDNVSAKDILPESLMESFRK
jgi:hypothetical protein